MLRSESETAAQDLRSLVAEADVFDLAFSAEVDRLMREAGMTYRDLAARTAVTETRLWNRLHSGGFTAPEQYRIARVLEVSLTDISARALIQVEEQAA